jgi:hypothetical protein
MAFDIVTGLVNDANSRQYLNPESNDFSSSATQFAIDVAIKASKGVGQGKTLTLSFIGFPATRRIIHQSSQN